LFSMSEFLSVQLPSGVRNKPSTLYNTCCDDG
jgi:hypothetical protein